MWASFRILSRELYTSVSLYLTIDRAQIVHSTSLRCALWGRAGPGHERVAWGEIEIGSGRQVRGNGRQIVA